LYLGLEYDSTSLTRSKGNVNNLAYPEFTTYDLAYKFKSMFYNYCLDSAKRKDVTADNLVKDLKNIAAHGSGSHEVCAELNPTKRCVQQSWGKERVYLREESAAYEALVCWLDKNITPGKMIFYI
jgi:hypothetical protein